ncbi:MAG: glutamate-5-semialdehyde dehydrogenase [Alphaproteobacteria bacterium]|nr:glutamate-5-semialdehyde dehydrogenase [Alphaproteobacteria bacterium]
MTMTHTLTLAKDTAPILARLTDEVRTRVLQDLARLLVEKTSWVLEANQKDLAQMDHAHPMYDRLLLTPERLQGIAAEVGNVAALPTPLDQTLFHTTRPNGLEVTRVSVPLGVVGMIYESRPNVTVDVFSLCFKSGNVAVLKGGKEADHTNKALVSLIHETLNIHGLPQSAATLLSATRQATGELLEAVGFVDVCIPRGSKSLIDYVRDNAKVPVIETGAGIVHTYIDESADLSMAKEILTNAKTRRTSVCNALDCLLVHGRHLKHLDALTTDLAAKNVEIYADARAHDALAASYPASLCHRATDEDFGREFLSLKLAIKIVDSLDEALSHIARFTSGHSEAIVTQDESAATRFLNEIDAAALYVNASTAFTDGAQFGLGAEIGISTQKLHARGPMGLEALTSYKWCVRGRGQIRP